MLCSVAEGNPGRREVSIAASVFSLEAIQFATQIGSQSTSTGVVDETVRLTNRFGVETVTFCGLPNSQQEFAERP